MEKHYLFIVFYRYINYKWRKWTVFNSELLDYQRVNDIDNILTLKRACFNHQFPGSCCEIGWFNQHQCWVFLWNQESTKFPCLWRCKGSLLRVFKPVMLKHMFCFNSIDQPKSILLISFVLRGSEESRSLIIYMIISYYVHERSVMVMLKVWTGKFSNKCCINDSLSAGVVLCFRGTWYPVWSRDKGRSVWFVTASHDCHLAFWHEMHEVCCYRNQLRKNIYHISYYIIYHIS